MDPTIILSLVNALDLSNIIGQQYRRLFSADVEASSTKSDVKAERADDAIVITNKAGDIYDKITVEDFERLDAHSQQLIKTLEESVNNNYERWRRVYSTRSVLENVNASEALKGEVDAIARQMCSDYKHILNYFHRIGKHPENYYKHVGFICDEMLKTPAPVLKKPIAPAHPPKGKKYMSSNTVKIIVALIGAAAIIIAAWLGKKYLSTTEPPSPVQYTGRVMGNNKPLKGAKVSVEEDQNVPQVQITDDEGIFHLTLPGTASNVRLRVAADNYEPVVRTVTLKRTGLEEISLPPIAKPTPGPGGLTFTGNPSLEEVRYSVAAARQVKISYNNPTCERAARKAVVELNGAQLDGSNVEEFLNNAKPRTTLRYIVSTIAEGSSYVIVCQ